MINNIGAACLIGAVVLLVLGLRFPYDFRVSRGGLVYAIGVLALGAIGALLAFAKGVT